MCNFYLNVCFRLVGLYGHQKAEQEWNELFAKYEEAYPELASEYKKWHELDVTDELLNDEDFWKFEKGCATRQASGDVLNKLTSFIPNLMGGSADLAP